jgi:hypothetical protein
MEKQVLAQEYAKHNVRFGNRQQDAAYPWKEEKKVHSE